MTATVDEKAPARRSPALGIVAFVLAIGVYLALPAVVALAGSLVPAIADQPPRASTTSVAFVFFAAIAVLGVVAAITRRGRGWAVAAIVIAVANNYSPIHQAIIEGVRAVFG